MHNPVFLFDTYEVARTVLSADVLEQAICTAVRLGKTAQPEEQQAAFLIPLVQAGTIETDLLLDDDVVREIVAVCAALPDETPEQRARRVLKSSNLSAIRLVLAQWYQAEYSGSAEAPELAKARRAGIRTLCRSLPAEVHSDILQGDIAPEDSDFLSQPDFPTMRAALH